MATTTNYGWDTPDDTDLVKDGAAAIRTLGSSIDTTTKNLNPQTTTGAIAYRSATSNVNTALALGTAGQVLQVNSGATAPEWATPALDGLVKITSATFSSVIGFSLPNGTFSSTYRNYLVMFNIDDNSTPTGVFLRMRNAGSDKTGASYYSGNWKIPYSGSAAMQYQTSGGTSSQIIDSFKDVICSLIVGNPFISTERTSIIVDTVEGELAYRQAGNVTFLSNDSCDSLSIFMTGGTFTGRYSVYGYAN